MENFVSLVNIIQRAYTALGDHGDESALPKFWDSLPSIAVVGGQGSGKSSVLESIVGKDFLPRGSGIVTRRPLVLKLHRVKENREWAEFMHLPRKRITDFADVRREIQDETDRETGCTKAISSVPIRLSIYSPNVVNLMLVDLPGLTKVAVEGQSESAVQGIENMVRAFIEKPNCIILAISPANQDIGTSDAIKICRDVDPKGERTFGVLTKVDLMDKGIDAVDILEGRAYRLQHPWVGVVNRSQADINKNVDVMAARRREREFWFKSPKYRHLANRMGSEFLTKTLSKHLEDVIKSRIPGLQSLISKTIINPETESSRVGKPVATDAGKKTSMPDCEEGETRCKVISLIEKATDSTEPEIDPRFLKAIKNVVKYSDSELRVAAKTLMSLMKRPHSQIRYLVLLIIDELFMRSKLFRTLIAENLDQLLSLAIGFRRNQPLPAPPSVASVLRTKAIEFLEKWNVSFGIHYRQIRLGYDYLKNNLKFQFPNLQVNAARIERERRERELKTQEILRNKFNTLKEIIPSIRVEINSTINEILECLDIARSNDEDGLAMDPLDDTEEDAEEIRNSELRQIRLNSLLEAEKVHENSDNKPVFDVLRELYKLLVTKHFVSVQQWISVLIKVEDDSRVRDNMLKEFIDFRNRILMAKKKCEESKCSLPSTTSEDDDIIWEEAMVDSMENIKYLTPVSTAKVVSAESASECSNRRQIIVETSSKESATCSNPVRSKLLTEAPVVKWGSSLDKWGEERVVLANNRGLEFDGHWGRVDYDATIPAEKIAELDVQAFVYKEEQVDIRPCRAPLSKGGFCQRKDLKVCPFHGPIVPRDDEGRPIDHGDGEGSASEFSNDERKPMNRNSSIEGINLDDQSLLVDQLAKQAVNNVRERDKEDAEKKAIDKKTAKRAKLAKVREHNDAVLREAAMASTSGTATMGEFEGGSSSRRTCGKIKKPTLASMLRKKVTAKDRLSQKLLNARARDATIKQLIQGEDTNYRESFPNQW